MTAQNILKFGNESQEHQRRGLSPSSSMHAHQPIKPIGNPYGPESPNDIEEFLLPGGDRFGLFSDPYARQVFVKANEGVRNGQFWLNEQLSDGHFHEKEVKILEFLSTVRIATRSQIHRALISSEDEIPEDDRSTVNFIKKCRKRGIICAFSWISPLQDERKKPYIYGLTRVGAQAAEVLFQKKLPDKFWLQPIDFPPGKSPSMDAFFLDLAAGELYSELVRIDRVVEWTRRPPIKLPGLNSNHYPYASFKVIKDKNDFKLFWIEIFRPTQDWINKVITRFQRTELAYNSLHEYHQPERIIMIVDGDSRVKQLSELAQQYMPNVEVRFTTDERLLAGIGDKTFLRYNFEKGVLGTVKIPYLQSDWDGMTATQYFDTLKLNIEDDDEL